MSPSVSISLGVMRVSGYVAVGLAMIWCIVRVVQKTEYGHDSKKGFPSSIAYKGAIVYPVACMEANANENPPEDDLKGADFFSIGSDDSEEMILLPIAKEPDQIVPPIEPAKVANEDNPVVTIYLANAAVQKNQRVFTHLSVGRSRNW